MLSGGRLARASACFLAWVAVDVLRHRVGGQEWGHYFAVLAIVTLASFAYLTYYIISEGLYEEILGSIVVSLVLMALTAIFPPFGILLFIWVLYNVAMTLVSIVTLLPLAILSLGSLVILFPLSWGEAFGNYVFTIVHPIHYVGSSLGEKYEASISYLDVGFLAIGAVHSLAISASPLKHAYARLALLGGSAGLIILSICAVLEGVRNVFQTNWTTSTQRIKVSQSVTEHFRSGGFVHVRGYERQVTQQVVSAVATRTVGSGAMTVAAAGASMKAAGSTGDSAKASLPAPVLAPRRRWWLKAKPSTTIQ